MAPHPHIKQVEFTCLGNDLAFLTPLIGLDHRAQEGIDKDLVILLDRFGIYPAVPGNVPIFRQFSVRETHGVKET
jgi:hypothetical protein